MVLKCGPKYLKIDMFTKVSKNSKMDQNKNAFCAIVGNLGSIIYKTLNWGNLRITKYDSKGGK